MKEKVLKQIKILYENINVLDNEFNSNNDLLEELKKDEKVLKCIKILDDNKNLIDNKRRIKNEINSLIRINCNHSIALYLGHDTDSYECRSYFKYKCIECGEIFETGNRLKNEINNVVFDLLNKEYYDYLLKYNENDALDILLYKYNGKLYNELIENGLETTKALNLVKKYGNKEL